MNYYLRIRKSRVYKDLYYVERRYLGFIWLKQGYCDWDIFSLYDAQAFIDNYPKMMAERAAQYKDNKKIQIKEKI